ncbi:beta-lactamase-like protein [Penicillium desertorum]|uniref:Beta-lactamase-like protein n=1 Tax=Penicillium desertorum TaxID=1303715 RepID=A0A9W9WIZ3_9EURO|nr:beta-lactamase-like protein [Penicillium desertorum]
MSTSENSSRGIKIPTSDHCIRVRAVNTTTRMVCDARAFVEPVIKHHTKLNLPTLCFLLERQTNDGPRYTLYDCGARKDFWNGSPMAKSMISNHISGLEVEKGVEEVLLENGIDLGKLDAIVWSHWHWDHIGDVSRFPDSVDIVVGPGFVENFTPGWPQNPSSPILARDIEGHRIHEPEFPLNIGGFNAHDYFGDGSFYLLDVPGHAVGHICGLARTTPNTFVFLGGDCCHFAGAFRPSPSYPMPEYLSGDGLDPYFSLPCPCTVFTGIHPTANDAERARVQPFYKVSRTAGSAYTFGDQAQESIDRLPRFDSDPNIFILLAHDNILFETLPLFNDFPDRDVNDWKKRGYKELCHWGFLNEFPRNDIPGRPPLVDGLRRDGRIIIYGDDGKFHDHEGHSVQIKENTGS